MRIIGGKNRGRKLLEPRGFRIRPTADRVREAIFNILSSYFQNGIRDKMVADLFSGTGALAIEALSRGAKSAVLVDNQAGAINLIKKNIQTCGEENNTFLSRYCSFCKLCGTLSTFYVFDNLGGKHKTGSCFFQLFKAVMGSSKQEVAEKLRPDTIMGS